MCLTTHNIRISIHCDFSSTAGVYQVHEGDNEFAEGS